jgi:hypothetical protein
MHAWFYVKLLVKLDASQIGTAMIFSSCNVDFVAAAEGDQPKRQL